MKTYTVEEMKLVIAQHVLWLNSRFADKSEGKRADLSGADLSGANLRNADLRSADLRNADLRNADLRSADLSDADLRSADLRSADLSDADLRNADLRNADLRSADLRSADLSDADLRSATLPTGEKWEIYLKEVVPALLRAGGKTLDVVCAGWGQCHEWSNCPMAQAFDVHSEDAAPILLRPRVVQFVQFYDAELIPDPTQPKKEG